MAETKTVLGRVMEALAVDSIADLARELGVAYNTAYAWSMRGKVPPDYVLATAIRTGHSAEWLEHGSGTAPPRRPDLPSTRERALINDFRELDEFSKRSLERITRALALYRHAEPQAPAPTKKDGKK